MDFLTLLASTEPAAHEAGIFEALGIDWTTLILQLIAFLILTWVLGKFAYPALIKAVDDRQATIEASVKAADSAKEHAAKAEQDVQKLLHEARQQAGEIVTTAKEEATAAVEAATAKAKAKADTIVTQAHEQIEKDVLAAKKALHNDTLELVALATEKVIGTKVDSKADKDIIGSVVGSVR